MEKLDLYRQYVEEILKGHFRPKPQKLEVEEQILLDRERDHYQLLQVGWHDEEEPIYQPIIHIDIKNNKIWIQRDYTEVGTANELLERGVPKEDIVLAFHSPYKRQFTDFAVA
jgi:hypothetical protein